MDYTPLTPPLLTDIPQPLETKEEIRSLYEALQVLPDLRRGQGKRCWLALLLCLLLLAKLA